MLCAGAMQFEDWNARDAVSADWNACDAVSADWYQDVEDGVVMGMCCLHQNKSGRMRISLGYRPLF